MANRKELPRERKMKDKIKELEAKVKSLEEEKQIAETAIINTENRLSQEVVAIGKRIQEKREEYSQLQVKYQCLQASHNGLRRDFERTDKLLKYLVDTKL